MKGRYIAAMQRKSLDALNMKIDTTFVGREFWRVLVCLPRQMRSSGQVRAAGRSVWYYNSISAVLMFRTPDHVIYLHLDL